MVGKVVSTKMTKTAVVLIESKKTHPLYRKSFLRTKKYLADDQLGVKDGDLVEIVKIRPISKRKHWKVTKVLGVDEVFLGEQALKESSDEAIAEVLPEAVEEPVESVKSVENPSTKAAQAKSSVKSVDKVEEKPKRVRKTTKKEAK